MGMTTNGSTPITSGNMDNSREARPEAESTVSAVREGDESAFTAVTSRYRRELHLYCSVPRLVQRCRGHGAGDLPPRLAAARELPGSILAEGVAVCHRDERLHRFPGRTRAPRVLSTDVGDGAPPHVPWLEPYPDRLLEPEAIAVARENIELAYLVAIQFLPPRQRAVLILTDVLEWSAKETADLLDLSVGSVTSALQRARATLRAHMRSGRPEGRPGVDPDEQQRILLRRCVEATERGDVKALTDLLRDDLRFSMPPDPETFVGRDAVVESWVRGGFGSPTFGELRCILTRANRMPAVASYLRRPGETEYRPLALDVLRIEDGLIVEIITFPLDGRVQDFDLPPVL